VKLATSCGFSVREKVRSISQVRIIPMFRGLRHFLFVLSSDTEFMCHLKRDALSRDERDFGVIAR